MTRFSLTVAALLAPTVLAIPKVPGYGYIYGSSSEVTGQPTGLPTSVPYPHPSGVSSGSLGPIDSSTAPYGLGNSTGIYGPTGTGTGYSSAPLSTVTVVPIPESSAIDTGSADVPGQPSATGNSPIGGSTEVDECGPATVTVTSANTVTVTVGAGPTSSAEESSPVSISSVASLPYPVGNETTVGPTGTVGSVSILPIESSSELPIPVYTGEPTTTAADVISTSVVSPIGGASSSAAHGYQHVSLHKPRTTSSAAVYVPEPSSSVAAYVPEPSSSVAVYVPEPSSSVAVYVPEPSSSTIAAEIPATTSSVDAGEFYNIPTTTAAPIPSTSSTTSSALATSTAASSPSTNGGTVVPRGLVYNTASLTALFEKDTIGWCYNWDSAPGGDISSSLNFVPMLWSTNEYHLPHWEERASTAIANGATHLLGFNEPDLTAQANMTPDQAAAAWTHMEKFAGKAKIGSPAVCNGGGEVGLAWLKKFMGACSGCTVDFIAIHWYGDANEYGLEALKQHIKDTQDVAQGRPIWLTEFQPKGDTQQQKDFMEKILPYLDDQSNGVERYAYFQVDGVLTSGSALSELGSAYLA